MPHPSQREQIKEHSSERRRASGVKYSKERAEKRRKKRREEKRGEEKRGEERRREKERKRERDDGARSSLTTKPAILCEAMHKKHQNVPKRHQLDKISSNSL